jgi:3-phenylpropionate/cinnamic acid dioxygenase small subunit
MTITEHALAGPDAALYQEIQQFYAYQMQLLDDGKAEEWGETFTEDGIMAANAHPAPTCGREALIAAAKAVTGQLAADGIRRRHFLGMVNIQEVRGDVVKARCYALVIDTARGEQANLRMSTLCVDELVRGASGWQIVRRDVSRDDLD